MWAKWTHVGPPSEIPSSAARADPAASITATAVVDWDTTGLAGTRQVYAKVHFWPTQESRPDNNTAQLAVPLGQTATSTPVVPEWSAFWLFAGGLLALGWLADRRRRR